mgnify:CR=1 FL=1
MLMHWGSLNTGKPYVEWERQVVSNETKKTMPVIPAEQCLGEV